MEIGAQLYTIKDYCKNLDELSLSLKKIADIGYKYVQISGTCPFEAKWLKKELDKNGLKCVLTHNPFDRIINDTVSLSKEHDVLGCKYVGLGHYAWDDNQTFEKFFDIVPPALQKLKDNGKYFMYHNHWHEYRKINGKLIIEYMAEIPSDLLGFTLDTYWVQGSGADPAEWIEILSGRVPCIHLKDFAFDKKMAVIGEGNINFDRVFKSAEKAKTEYMLVEQDDTYGEDPFECLKRSYLFLKSRGF